MQPKRLLILGSTGSIGVQSLQIVAAHPQRLQVVGLAAGHNWQRLHQQAEQFSVPTVGLADQRVAEGLSAAAPGLQVYTGEDGLAEMVRVTEPDLVVGAISGIGGLQPVMAALEAGCDVALANKEPLVAAGELITTTAARAGAHLVPIDSEISAIFQCLQGQRREDVEKILLTASGGPFAELQAEELSEVTPQQALDHPTWKMGAKVTVDSATLMNKGFEVFELKWLFGVEFDQIEVVVHHQSVIHSLVQFCDGSVLAQMSLPDMRLPIHYALFYPERVGNDLPRLDLVEAGPLTFAEPDVGRFPNLRLAYEAGKAGASYPAVLNAANEVAVDLFLQEEIGFNDLPFLVERALEAHEPIAIDYLQDVKQADTWARDYTRQLVEEMEGDQDD